MQARTTSARFDSSAQRKRSPDWPSSSPRGAGRGADQLAYLSAPIKAAPSSPDAALGSQKKKQERPQKEEKKKLERHPGRSAHGTRVEHVEVKSKLETLLRLSGPLSCRRPPFPVRKERTGEAFARSQETAALLLFFLPSFLPPSYLPWEVVPGSPLPTSTRRPARVFSTPGSAELWPAPTQSSGSPMRLEAAARMDLFRKLWRARKLILVVFIPLSLLPLPLIHPTSVSTSHARGTASLVSQVDLEMLFSPQPMYCGGMSDKGSQIWSLRLGNERID